MPGYLPVIIFPKKADYSCHFVEPSEGITLRRAMDPKGISLSGLKETDICSNVTIRCDQVQNGTSSMSIYMQKSSENNRLHAGVLFYGDKTTARFHQQRVYWWNGIYIQAWIFSHPDSMVLQRSNSLIQGCFV